MAFQLKNLIAFGTGAAGGQVFHYQTNDLVAVVEGAGYFNGASTLVKVGDIIIVSGDLDGTPFQTTYVVGSNTGGTVSVTPGANQTFSATYVLTVDIADLSADTSYFVVAPIAGAITKMWSVIDGAVATADVTITAEIGGTPVTGGVITIATAGSAAGDVDSATPSGANTVTAGQAIELVVAGGGTGGSPRGHVSIVITP